MYVIWPNTFWMLVTMYLKSLFPKYHIKKSKTYRGGRKNHFFVSTGRWWNNHLQIQFLVTKLVQKFNLTRFSDPRSPNCGYFNSLLLSKSFFTNGMNLMFSDTFRHIFLGMTELLKKKLEFQHFFLQFLTRFVFYPKPENIFTHISNYENRIQVLPQSWK